MKTTDIQKAFIFPPEKQNVGSVDRLISAAAGTILMMAGFRNFRKGGYSLLLPAGYLMWRSVSGYCHLYKAIGIDTTEGAQFLELTKSITIQRNKSEVYNYWRQLENLPLIMTHVSKVDKISDKKYRWDVEFNKQHFRWNAELIDDTPNKRISWVSVDSPDVKNSGSVEFNDAANGATEIVVNIIYKPAKTTLGRAVAKVLNPLFKQRVKDDLKEFKRIMEAENLKKTSAIASEKI